MKALEWTTTVPCVNNCIYCPQYVLQKNYQGPKSLSYRDFKILINTVPKSVDVHFSGFSEPFFNSACIDMIEYSAKRGHKIIIFTTTIGMSAQDMRDLKYIDCELNIHVASTGFQYQDLWQVNFIKLQEHGFKFKLIKVGDKFSNSVLKLIKNHNDIEEQPIVSRAGNLNTRHKYMRGKFQCKDNRQDQNVILPNGEVYLCCSDYSLDYRIGNLFEQNYFDLFKSEVYKNVFEEMRNEKGNKEHICRKCHRAINVK